MGLHVQRKLKGLNQAPERVAPKAFRELWGMEAPVGTPDFPASKKYTATSYQILFIIRVMIGGSTEAFLNVVRMEAIWKSSRGVSQSMGYYLRSSIQLAGNR